MDVTPVGNPNLPPVNRSEFGDPFLTQAEDFVPDVDTVGMELLFRAAELAFTAGVDLGAA